MLVKRFDFVGRTGVSSEPVVCKIGWVESRRCVARRYVRVAFASRLWENFFTSFGTFDIMGGCVVFLVSSDKILVLGS